MFEIKNPKHPPNKHTIKVINFIKKVILNIKEKGNISQFNIEPPKIAKINSPTILFLIIVLSSLKQFEEGWFITMINE